MVLLSINLLVDTMICFRFVGYKDPIAHSTLLFHPIVKNSR